ncbi:MAG: cytochrome bc complex cytochrome b subunit, partial [Acidobacteriota bacterium]|nr:cytochrome bc complex cytochrome b subunit [Acidobacteriota bacterium]
YFLFMFQTLKYLPAKILVFEGEVIGILAFMLGGLIWLLVPFINRRTDSKKAKVVFNVFGGFVLMFIVVMTIIGFLD